MTEQNQTSEDPTPTDQFSTDPTSTEPTPTDQFSADPISTDPTPTDPISAEPTPTDQFSADPISTDPTPTDPISAEPTPTDQFSTDPISTDPTLNDQVSTEPTSSDQASNGSSTGKTIGIILLALVGVAVVLVLGYFLAQAISGDSNTADASDPTVVAPTPAPNAPYLVANTHVNIRSGPGTQYPVYGVSSPGQSAEVTGVSPDYMWWMIKIPTSVAPDGKGWMSADYVTVYNTQNVPVVQPPPPPPEVQPPPPDTSGAYGVTTDVINVRAGPSNQTESYGKVPLGTTFQIVGISDDGKWYAASIPTAVAPNGIGWVNANYVDVTNADGVPITSP
jgi:uncharacterized protein YraI